ncbi:MAG TPA: hypothetical protein VFK48_16005 [Usitatibacter sp.]|nr:hypothetical protein [Usitatibacter sp.]
MRRLLVLATLLAAAGCAVRPPLSSLPPDKPETPAQAVERRTKASRPTYNLAGYPPAVREGYIDGCESAKRSAYARKDAKRFASDPQYEMGWNDGYGICGRPKSR